jgi:hypothetical protein
MNLMCDDSLRCWRAKRGVLVESVWRPDGSFSVAVGERRVQGWAPSTADLTEVLLRAGMPSDEVASIIDRCPTATVKYDREAMLHAYDLDQAPKDVFIEAAAQRDLVLEHLKAARVDIPESDSVVKSWLAQRAAQLNAEVPQVDAVSAFEHPHLANLSDDPSKPRGFAGYFDWIDPRRVISTPDPVWNELDRHDRDHVVDYLCCALRDAETEADRYVWLARFSLEDTIIVDLVPGPAGPVYSLTIRGSHRTHTARLLQLPLILAEVRIDNLSYPSFPCDSHPAPIGQQERIWAELERRGVFKARIEKNDIWHLSHVRAEWMLLEPALAVQTNRAYEQVYPGSLRHLTGLEFGVLTDEDKWTSSLGAEYRAKQRWWQRLNYLGPARSRH